MEILKEIKGGGIKNHREAGNISGNWDVTTA